MPGAGGKGASGGGSVGLANINIDASKYKNADPETGGGDGGGGRFALALFIIWAGAAFLFFAVEGMSLFEGDPTGAKSALKSLINAIRGKAGTGGGSSKTGQAGDREHLPSDSATPAPYLGDSATPIRQPFRFVSDTTRTVSDTTGEIQKNMG